MNNQQLERTRLHFKPTPKKRTSQPASPPPKERERKNQVSFLKIFWTGLKKSLEVLFSFFFCCCWIVFLSWNIRSPSKWKTGSSSNSFSQPSVGGSNTWRNNTPKSLTFSWFIFFKKSGNSLVLNYPRRCFFFFSCPWWPRGSPHSPPAGFILYTTYLLWIYLTNLHNRMQQGLFTYDVTHTHAHFRRRLAEWNLFFLFLFLIPFFSFPIVYLFLYRYIPCINIFELLLFSYFSRNVSRH